MAKKNERTFEVHALAMVLTSVKVTAASLEEAAVKARDLKVTDFVDIPGDHNDSRLVIESVSEYSAVGRILNAL